jgi:hypothetical protein
MTILTLILLVTSTFMVGVVLACMATNFKTYKRYKETYEILKSGKLVIAFETPEIVVLNEEGDDIFGEESFNRSVVFHKKGTVRLYGSVAFLHNAYFTKLDPYSHYWLIKITKWFSINKSKLRKLDLGEEAKKSEAF